jgi:hypothetical protein
MSKSAKKINGQSINRYLENVNIRKNNIINNKFRSKSPKNTNNNNFLSVSNINNNLSNSQNNYPSYYTNGNNKYYISPHSNIENSIVNEVFSNEDFKKMDNMNKFQILASLNNQIDKYNKGIPQLVNKVNETIQKINNSNALDNLTNNTHPLIKMASKNAGQILQLHTNEIGEEIINDLLIEIVYELQFIEDQKSNKENNNVTVYLQQYYKNLKEMENMERIVLSQLSNKNPLTPYESISNNLTTNVNTLKKPNIIKDDNIIINKVEDKQIEILNPFDENYNGNNNFISNGDEFLFINEKPKSFITTNHPKTILNAELYAKEFKEYMLLKGSFYYPNIFGIYDEVVKELTNNILEEECDKCLRQIDNTVDEMYREEVLKADLK